VWASCWKGCLGGLTGDAVDLGCLVEEGGHLACFRDNVMLVQRTQIIETDGYTKQDA
jgi:hypothetical protein